MSTSLNDFQNETGEDSFLDGASAAKPSIIIPNNDIALSQYLAQTFNVTFADDYLLPDATGDENGSVYGTSSTYRNQIDGNWSVSNGGFNGSGFYNGTDRLTPTQFTDTFLGKHSNYSVLDDSANILAIGNALTNITVDNLGDMRGRYGPTTIDFGGYSDLLGNSYTGFSGHTVDVVGITANHDISSTSVVPGSGSYDSLANTYSFDIQTTFQLEVYTAGLIGTGTIALISGTYTLDDLITDGSNASVTPTNGTFSGGSYNFSTKIYTTQTITDTYQYDDVTPTAVGPGGKLFNGVASVSWEIDFGSPFTLGGFLELPFGLDLEPFE